MCPNGSLDREGIEQLYAMPRRLIINMILIITKMVIIKKMLVITKMLISTIISLVITISDGLSLVLHRNAKVFIDQMFRLFDRDGNGKISFRVMSKFRLLV